MGFFQSRKCSKVQNDLFALVTCDLSNHNGGIHLVYKQWPGAQDNHQLKATEKHKLQLWQGKEKE